MLHDVEDMQLVIYATSVWWLAWVPLQRDRQVYSRRSLYLRWAPSHSADVLSTNPSSAKLSSTSRPLDFACAVGRCSGEVAAGGWSTSRPQADVEGIVLGFLASARRHTSKSELLPFCRVSPTLDKCHCAVQPRSLRMRLQSAKRVR